MGKMMCGEQLLDGFCTPIAVFLGFFGSLCPGFFVCNQFPSAFLALSAQAFSFVISFRRLFWFSQPAFSFAIRSAFTFFPERENPPCQGGA
jgi:hypothetical protein